MSNLWVEVEELDSYANSEYAYEAVKTASQLLWSMSGRKYGGITTVTERYICASRAYRLGASSRNYTPELVGGDVYNLPFDEFDDYAEITTDGMSPSTRLRLRGRPVVRIHEIRDRSGKIIDPSKYYLVDHSTIQARAGFAWTPCNIEITYSYGSPPPASGKAAARVLATEFIKAWSGDSDCQLPQRITSVSRQGVSYTILDSQDFIDELRTGLYVVDLFLKSANPDKARAKARVFSPDVPRARRLIQKPPVLGTGPLDMYITGNEGGTVQVNLSYINAGFLASDPDWTPALHIGNYTGTDTKALSSNAVFINAILTDITKSVTHKELNDNTVTLTTSTPHGYATDDIVTIANIDATFNGTYQISNVPSEDTFSYARLADDVAFSTTSGTAVVTNESRDTITLSVTYNDAYKYVGFLDPGTWDLYASRPSLADPTVDETVYIASGNLILRLAGQVTPTYTLGNS